MPDDAGKVAKRRNVYTAVNFFILFFPKSNKYADSNSVIMTDTSKCSLRGDEAFYPS